MNLNEAKSALRDIFVSEFISVDNSKEIVDILEAYGRSEYGRGSNDGYREATKFAIQEISRKP